MRFLKQTILLAAAFLFTLALCEIYVRVSHIGSVSMMEFYEDIGRGWRKDLKYVYFNEGFGIGRYNQYRYIGEALPPHKDSAAFRVALLGDSFIASWQIFERDYFGNIAEEILSDAFPRTRFEILNFGRAGHDLADMYAYQKKLVEDFEPDLIVYMISGGDIIPKYRDPLSPWTVVENGRPVITTDYPETELNIYQNTKVLTQNSCILSMLNDCRRKAMETPVASILLEKAYTWFWPPVIAGEDAGSTNEINDVHPVTEAIIRNLDPGRVIIVNRSEDALPSDFLEVCEETGLDTYTLAHVFSNMRQSGINPVEWKVTHKLGHWNPYAHRFIAIEFADLVRNYYPGS